MDRADVAVIGGGIIGLATARAALQQHPGHRVVVLEKEGAIATHQSGRNSGVIHAGAYYQPGSEKARMCTAGRHSMIAYCAERGIAHDVCGKVIVAVDDDDRCRLHDLENRCKANDVRARTISGSELRDIEPHVAGVAAIHVLDTGITDYSAVCRALADDVVAAGAEIRLDSAVLSGSERPEGLVLDTTTGEIAADRVVGCAGLHADVVARAVSGLDGDAGLRIVAFRGEYRELAPERSHLVRALVYPVPDPQFPFLGVHLTRAVDGHVHVGPNAVLAFAREGYEWRRIDVKHLRSTFAHSGFRSFAARHWRFGVQELVRSLSHRRFTAEVKRLVPEIHARDLTPAPAGVRAQAIARDGSIVDDFAIRRSGRAVHVLNAPSPAATASLEIGTSIARQLDL